MTKTEATLVAVFRDRKSAERAVEELTETGFTSEDIYVSSEQPSYAGALAEGEAEIRAGKSREGGLKGWLKSIFGKHDEARYEELMRTGSVLVSVNATGERVDRAVDILNNHSPVEVHTGAEAAPREFPEGAASMPAGTTAEPTQSVPVVEEELKVGKRAVLRGGVRVYSRVVEEPVEENINLQEEHVRVERQPADRPAAESDFRPGQEQVIEVKEYAEEPVVSKEARVVEDVRVGKDKTDRTETVRDTVRRTEAEIENIDETSPGSQRDKTGR